MGTVWSFKRDGVMSGVELLSFPSITENEEKVIDRLLSSCTVFPISSMEKEKTIKLRRKYRIKLPDALIAASAIVQELPLVTADMGFAKIEELEAVFINPRANETSP